MHPKIETRRKTVELSRKTQDFEDARRAILLELQKIHDALSAIDGGYMNMPSIHALLATCDEIQDALKRVRITDDDSGNERCEALVGSASRFVDSAKRTLSAAEDICSQ